MSRPRLTRLTVVWLALVAATLLSWYFGAGHGIGSSPTATALVLVIAFAKVRLIGLDFMELRAAPIWLRATFEGYCALVCGTLLALYFMA